MFVFSRVPSYCARYCVGCFRCGGAGVNKAEGGRTREDWGVHCSGWVGIYRLLGGMLRGMRFVNVRVFEVYM